MGRVSRVGRAGEDVQVSVTAEAEPGGLGDGPAAVGSRQGVELIRGGRRRGFAGLPVAVEEGPLLRCGVFRRVGKGRCPITTVGREDLRAW